MQFVLENCKTDPKKIQSFKVNEIIVKWKKYYKEYIEKVLINLNKEKQKEKKTNEKVKK